MRRDARNANLFAFDNKQPFFAIGENMCWPASGPRGAYDYEDWLPALAQGGGNWIRVWSHRWNCCLEWGTKGKADWETVPYLGLGYYNLANAWKLDVILDAAEKNSVYVMLCLGTYGEFINGGFFNEGLWASNPYNAANGGPCAKPEDFWSNAAARKLYRQRLRYVAARYGSYPSLFAWEFWNEAYPTPAWVAEMGQFLKGAGDYTNTPADPYRHLVSTTYGTPEIWKVAEVDFTQSHHYGDGSLADSAPVILSDATQARAFGKPHLMAEFGIDWRSSDDKYDPQFLGVNMHNGLWASALSGNAGSAMIWYWDSYVHPGKLYTQFTPLRAFADAIPWDKGPWNSIVIDAARVKVDARQETWRDLVTPPSQPWGKSTEPEFTVAPLETSAPKSIPTYIYGLAKPDLRTPLVFRTHYEAAGRFSLKVNMVSSSARLRIVVDNAPALDRTLSATPPEKGGPAIEYQSTEFHPEYGIYQATFAKEFGVAIPAGAHTIGVEVVEGDWLSVSEYRFAGYVSSRFPHVNLCGIGNGVKAYLWAQNGEHHWLNRKMSAEIPVVRNATAIVRGLPNGAYRCAWWDTWKGGVTRQNTVASMDGALELALPDLATDCAASIEPAQNTQ